MPNVPATLETAVSAFKALADPVRWRIVERLAEGPRSASELGEGFDISAPAISRHLKVLLEGGVVAVEAQGRQRVYSLLPDALSGLAASLEGLAGDAPQAPGEPPRAAYALSPASSDWRVW